MAHNSLADMAQAVCYHHGTHLYLPTWHRPLVIGMAHTFTYRHGTDRYLPAWPTLSLTDMAQAVSYRLCTAESHFCHYNFIRLNLPFLSGTSLIFPSSLRARL